MNEMEKLDFLAALRDEVKELWAQKYHEQIDVNPTREFSTDEYIENLQELKVIMDHARYPFDEIAEG